MPPQLRPRRAKASGIGWSWSVPAFATEAVRSNPIAAIEKIDNRISDRGERPVKQAKCLFSIVIVAVLLSGNWSSARAQSEITLLAPSPTRRPLDRILSNFQAKTAQKVRVTYSGA